MVVPYGKETNGDDATPVETQCLCLGNNTRRGHSGVFRKQGGWIPSQAGYDNEGWVKQQKLNLQTNTLSFP